MPSWYDAIHKLHVSISMNPYSWPTSLRNFEDIVQKHALPLYADRKANRYEVCHQEIFWLQLPWRNKPFKAQSRAIKVDFPGEHIDVLTYLKEFSKKHAGVEHALNVEAAGVFSSAAFIDEDHRREFISRVEDSFKSGAYVGMIEAMYTRVTNQRLTVDRWGDLTKQLCVDDYPLLFPLAQTLQRRATVILGPTNSGKTYKAVQLLKEAKTGAYWGPLRLLALEIQDRLTEEGVACSLLTGEERVQIPGAGHVASTIEMMQSDVELDTIVIDEVQMLADKDRGWAWTQAIVGCPSKNVVLVGSPDIWEVLKGLLRRLGMEYDLIKCERLQPLHVEESPCSIEDAKAGDAFVVFSRKDVFFYQEMLAKRGLSTAIIYGALGPEVRRSEAQRFRSGEAKVLIATDAIGMGLNLPIARMIFTTMEKFDGIEVGPIAPALVKQIAGRAGRFGQFPDGYVGAIDVDALAYVRRCLSLNTKEVPQKLGVAPTVEQLTLLAKEMQIAHPSRALIAWRTKLLLSDAHFFAAPMFERVELSIEMEEHFPALSFEEIARLSMVPLPKVLAVKQKLFTWLQVFDDAKRSPKSEKMVRWAPSNEQVINLGLAEAENLYHTASMYCWLARSFPDVFVGEQQAQDTRTMVADHLIELLRARARALIVLNQGRKMKVKPVLER